MEEKIPENDLFEHIFEISPQTISITSLLEGLYLKVNPAFEKATGYSREEVIGKTTSDIKIWEDPNFRKNLISQLTEKGEVRNIESRFRRKDGTIGYTIISGKIINYNGIQCLFAFFEDISQQKAKELEHNNTINNLPLGIFKSTVDGKILSANMAMSRIYGFDSVEEMLCQPASEFYSQEDDRKTMLRELEQKGTLLNYETLERKKDGSKIWVSTNYKAIYNDSNKLEFIEGIIEDITKRKQIEDDFHQSRELLLSFINSHPEIMFLKDDQFKYIITNQKSANFFGRSIDQLLLHSDYDLMDKEAADNCRFSDIKALQTNGLITNIETLNNRIYETIKFPVKIGKTKTGLGGIIRDITERRKMEDSLRESEERFRELFENNHTVLLLINPDTGDIIDGNLAATKFYRYSKKELRTLHFQDINTETPETVDAELKKIKNEKGSHYITQHRLISGEKRFVEIYSGFINTEKRDIIYSFIYDITKQVDSQKKLEILNKAIDQSSSCIVITDKQGTIEFVNPAFTSISGYSKEEAIGQNPRILKSGLQPNETYKVLWNTILSGKSWSGEFTNKRKDGEIYWEKATISPIVDQDGAITHFVAIKDDISHQKKLIQDLVIAKNKAEESNKLKSAFLSNMSHEIRTPLNSIIGFADLLIDDGNSKEHQDEFKRYIIESSDQLLSVVNDVLDMSLIETKQVTIFNETFDINTFITEVGGQFAKRVQLKGLKYNIRKPLESGTCQVYSDFNRLKQIVEKLFSNAIKFTEKGEITIGYDFEDEKLRIFVQDTGIGIHEDKQFHIYESFTQASNELNRTYGGLGLGLTISKKISELLGVEIKFRSVQNLGTTFYIVLPETRCQILHSPSSIEIDNEQIGIQDFPFKIMIVEDDISNFEYLKTILERFGLEIIHVKNGDEALPSYKNNKDVKLVIMDIRLPRMDGWQATKLLKEYDPRIPIIVLTAFAQEGDMQHAKIAGADMFLTKPTRPEVLIKHIMNLTQTDKKSS